MYISALTWFECRYRSCLYGLVLPKLNMLGWEFFRYGLASGGALLADILVFRGVLNWGLSYMVAGVAGFCAGLLVNYWLSIQWVFGRHLAKATTQEFLLFSTIGVFGLMLTEGLLWVGVERLGLGAVLAKLISVGPTFIFNFFLRKTLLFSKRV